MRNLQKFTFQTLIILILPPLKKVTPSDVVAFMWEYMKVPENSREKVKNLLKDANENGVKLSHQAPTLYDVVPKMEIK